MQLPSRLNVETYVAHTILRQQYSVTVKSTDISKVIEWH